MRSSLKPKLFTVLGEYNRSQLIRDITAGILVGIIAIPLSIALAISSGVSPEMGINTAIVAGFFISFLGGSRVQIGGPTAAFVPIVYQIVKVHGLNGLAVATIMAGIFLIIMGICRMGKMIKYIPYTVVTGFTAGIAGAIFFQQIKEFLGLSIDSIPSDFTDLMIVYGKTFHTLSTPTALIGLGSLAIMIIWGKFPGKIFRYIPGSLVAIVISTLLVTYYAMGDVSTIGSVYPNIKAGLPPLTIPTNVSIPMIKSLIVPALSIAILASIESLLSAVVSDGMIGGHHRSNAELVGQGTANIFSAFLGGIPATGAIARTAANVRSGGRTPIAGLVHCVTVLTIMVVLMPWAKLIPLTTLAAILIVVAYNMADWQVFRDIRSAPKSDSAVFLLTFALTVIFDLVIAIEVGMVLAAFLFIKRMSDVTEVFQISSSEENNESDQLSEEENRHEILIRYGEQALIYEIRGPFFFGAADKLADTLGKIGLKTKLLIIKMQNVPTIDSTGMHFLETLCKTCQHKSTTLYFTHLQSHPHKALEKAGLIKQIGNEYFQPDISSALEHFQHQQPLNETVQKHKDHPLKSG